MQSTSTNRNEEADMAKDIHSEVEGHAMRGKDKTVAQVEGHGYHGGRSDSEPPTDDTTVRSDEARRAGAPEVEGQAMRGRGAPAADVEGHALRVRGRSDAEAPSEDATPQADEPRDAGEPEVEGHGTIRVK
jgi:hypothetical protein